MNFENNSVQVQLLSRKITWTRTIYN
jgi:hypothetical protein